MLKLFYVNEPREAQASEYIQKPLRLAYFSPSDPEEGAGDQADESPLAMLNVNGIPIIVKNAGMASSGSAQRTSAA